MAKKTSKELVTPWEVTADMFLSEMEVAGLLEHVRQAERDAVPAQRGKSTVDRLIIELLMFSGLRNSELCHLRICDSAVRHGQSGVQVSGTPKQDRLVHIPNSVNQLVLDYIRSIRRDGEAPKLNLKHDEQPLILNERGNAYDRTALYRRVIRVLSEAGLGDRASVQLLRHTYGFLAYKRTGGNLLFVQQQMGHAHPMVTAVYAQFVEFSYADLANQISVEMHAAHKPKRQDFRSTRKKGTSK